MNTLADSFVIIFKQDSPYLPFFTGSILFIGVLIATHMISRALWGALKFLHLNFINRFFGVIFGVVKGGFLLSAILLFFAHIDLPGASARTNSLLYPHLIDLAPMIYDFIASNFPSIEELRITLEKSIQNQDYLNEFFEK
jgi:membrane protein required for colicin V production